MPGAPKRQAKRPRDFGRGVAALLCALFALVGTVPLALGLLVRTRAVREWAARETSALLAREFGVSARYRVVVQAWPLLVGLDDLVVDADDGKRPFLEVEHAAVRPRLFSLLAGKLDVGDIEIVGPRVHAVVEHGELVNFHPRTPAASAPSSGPRRLPLSSLAVTDARVDAVVDGVAVAAREIDVDLTTEPDGALEVALRAGRTTVTRVRPILGREGEDAVDEDVVCRLDARVRVEDKSVLVRRLALLGSADLDPDPGTRPACALPDGDWRAFELRLGAFRVTPREGGLPSLGGRVRARIPVALAHRFVALPPATGAVDLDVEASFDGTSRLPRVTGHVGADDPGIDGKLFAERFDAEVVLANDVVEATKVGVTWGDGKIGISDVKIEPFGKDVPLEAGAIDIDGVDFNALLRDLGAHPDAHVAWTFEKGHLPHFGGTLAPLSLKGPITVKTKDFAVFDRTAHDPARVTMMGVKEANVRGTFMVKPTAVVLSGFSVDTPRSHLGTTVSLGFASVLDIEVYDGSHVDLADISPLAGLPIGGVAKLRATARGPFDHPKIEADLSVDDFAFAGFSIGDVDTKAAFEPLHLDLTDARVRHRASRIRSPHTRIAFDDASANVVVDADVDTRDAPHLTVADLFDVFHLDRDPRLAGIAGTGSGTGHVHFAIGGREDRCGGGYLDVQARMQLADVTLFGERFDDGYGDVSLVWDDQAAGANGMRVDVRAASLRKDTGTVVASGTVRHGGQVRLNVVGSGLPLARLDALGPAGKMFDGKLALVADVSGTFDALQMVSDVDVTRVRIGPSTLPPSRFRLTMEPAARAAPAHPPQRTRCDDERAGTFDRAEYDRDVSSGVFRVKGELFDGQVALDDVRITQQRHAVLSGRIGFEKLDLGTLANLVPGVAFADAAPTGRLSGSIDVKSLPFADPRKADVSVSLRELSMTREGRTIELTEPSKPIALANQELTIPDLHLRARTRSGLSASFTAGGAVHHLATSPDLALGLRLDPLDLSGLRADFPELARASGTVRGDLRVEGPARSPHLSGAVHLEKGELALKGSPVALEDLAVDVEIGSGEVRLSRATARVGGGTVSMNARLPVHGLELGTATAVITARGVKLPVADGVDLTADADLDATYRPSAATIDGERNLPDVKGTISLTSFRYTRPITMSLNLSQLTGRPQRTNVETYDPADDFVRFRLTVVSPKPLRFTNNLVDMQLEVVDPGLVLSGTNQRFGAQGLLRVLPDSKLKLRSTEFDVREGFVRFDDPARVVPNVEVRAQTEYRRYAETAGAEPAASASGGAGASGANTSGQWRINLHAHGEPENLKLALTSDPPLSQEDIVLLLTMGMTRAEIDRGLASSLGQTVGLEALSQLTGADQAVKTIVPLIDEFRFGTGYSSKTGRTEPTVTLGKRITDDVRANVTTGLTENREVRSSVEWKMSHRTSVQGSYDNVNDVSSSLLGNIGVDLRWRLEFE